MKKKIYHTVVLNKNDLYIEIVTNFIDELFMSVFDQNNNHKGSCYFMKGDDDLISSKIKIQSLFYQEPIEIRKYLENIVENFYKEGLKKYKKYSY